MRKSSLSKIIQKRLIEHFVAGITTRCAAELVGFNRNTTTSYYQRLREIISQQLEKESEEVFKGEIEVDKSFWWGPQGQVWAGSSWKSAPTFGVLKLCGRVYTKIIPYAFSSMLIPSWKVSRPR